MTSLIPRETEEPDTLVLPMMDGVRVERYRIVQTRTSFLLQSVDRPEHTPIWVDEERVGELLVDCGSGEMEREQ